MQGYSYSLLILLNLFLSHFQNKNTFSFVKRNEKLSPHISTDVQHQFMSIEIDLKKLEQWVFFLKKAKLYSLNFFCSNFIYRIVRILKHFFRIWNSALKVHSCIYFIFNQFNLLLLSDVVAVALTVMFNITTI